MKISISILNAKDRQKEVLKVNNTNINYLHIDLMDGKFVLNKQFTNQEIIKLNDISTKKIDLHMMVEDPLKYLKKFSLLNIEYVTFHYEIKKDLDKIIKAIKEYGFKVGIAINPNTNVDEILPYLEKVDLVLVMSVEPGAGGQEFRIDTLSKVEKLNKLKEEYNFKFLIEVDGGINDIYYDKLIKVNTDISY